MLLRHGSCVPLLLSAGIGMASDDSRKRLLSLIEFGIVAVVLGVLAALVIPSLMRTIKERRSAEATENLRVLFNAASEYYAAQVEEANGDNSQATFPGSTETAHPAEIGRKAVTTSDWHMVPVFRALEFEVLEPHFYQYSFESEGVGDNARFTASAFGDLNGDGVKSRFQMEGFIENGEVRGRTIIVDRLE